MDKLIGYDKGGPVAALAAELGLTPEQVALSIDILANADFSPETIMDYAGRIPGKTAAGKHLLQVFGLKDVEARAILAEAGQEVSNRQALGLEAIADQVNNPDKNYGLWSNSETGHSFFLGKKGYTGSDPRNGNVFDVSRDPLKSGYTRAAPLVFGDASLAEQPSSTEPLSTQRAQEQQAYADRLARQEAHQSEMEGYQSQLAQDKSEAQAKALAEAEAQSMTSLRASEAQQEAKSYADWSGDAGLAGTPGPQATPATTPAGTVASPHGGGQPTISITPLGGGWKSASGGLVQNMYDGGVVRMAEGGEAKGIRHLLRDQTENYIAGITSDSKTLTTSDDPVWLSPQQLKDIPGYMGEEERRGDPNEPKYQELRKSIEELGYQDYEGNPLTTDPIHISVDAKGQPYIMEGNNRLVEAIQSGRDSIPVELTYLGGSEHIEGAYNPDKLIEGPRVLRGDERGGIRLEPEQWKDILSKISWLGKKVLGKSFSPLGFLMDASPAGEGSTVYGNIEQEIDPSAQEGMKKTARRWEKPKVYSNVLYKGIKGKSILNFGSGPQEIIDASIPLKEIMRTNSVTNYDFKVNPDALKNVYDLVMASNVLNVQPNIDTLNITINQITNSIREGGQVIFNLPSSPRKGAYDNLTTSQAKDMLTQKFEDQGVRGTWKNEIFTGSKSERPPPPRISGTPTRAERIEMQGGPLSRRLKEEQIVRLLEGHGFNWEYNEAGGITAIESDNSKKHFRENTSLRTIRDWLGYYKGGQVRPMYDGGLV